MSITMQHRLTAEDEEKLKELLEKAVSESEKLIRDGSLDIVVATETRRSRGYIYHRVLKIKVLAYAMSTASLEADYNVREIEELVQD